jgi:hypothetical protein
VFDTVLLKNYDQSAQILDICLMGDALGKRGSPHVADSCPQNKEILSYSAAKS